MGPVPMPGADAGDPLRRGARSGLVGRHRNALKASLPSELVRDLVVARGRSACRRLGELIRFLIARYPVVCGDLADDYLVVASEDPATNLHRRDGEMLAWAQGVGPHSADGGG